MPQININQKLDELLATKFETEVIEFKEAKNDFSFEELGKYFSALSNEANLHNVECAWLVFGVEDKKHKVVGTNYRLDDKSLNNLKEVFLYAILCGQCLLPPHLHYPKS